MAGAERIRAQGLTFPLDDPLTALDLQTWSQGTLLQQQLYSRALLFDVIGLTGMPCCPGFSDTSRNGST